MLGKEDIISGSLQLHDAKSCFVYFLIMDGDIVYIGKSVSFNNRIKDHIRTGMVFDSVFLLHISESELDEIERVYIEAYKPRYNVVYASSKEKRNAKTMAKYCHIKTGWMEIRNASFISTLTLTEIYRLSRRGDVRKKYSKELDKYYIRIDDIRMVEQGHAKDAQQ